MTAPRPRVFQVARFDPRTGRLLIPTGRQPLMGSPLQRRGFGDVPNSAGGPGNPVEPYTESEVWNNFDGTGIAAPPATPTAAPTSVSGQGGIGGQGGAATAIASPLSAPFGESDRPWSNPTTFASVPIQSGTGLSAPVLSQNAQRNSLIIQNNSSATSPDVAPTFYIGFNTQPTVGFSMALAPGVGFSWDIITPRDSIYVLVGPFSGASVVIAGVAVQGTYSPLSSFSYSGSNQKPWWQQLYGP